MQPHSPLSLGYHHQVNTICSDVQPTVSLIAPFQGPQFLPPVLTERGERDCAEYDGSDMGKVHARTLNTMRVVTLGVGSGCREPPPDLSNLPVGEEQRSDSGRGASDEEITSQAVPTKSYNGSSTKFRSATLKGTQENVSHIMSGLVFPSLPRITSGKGLKYPVD